MIVNLPRHFRDAWASAWKLAAPQITVYVVPPCREKEGEKHVRQLHAKAVAIADGARVALLCGSSDFSPHGMGIGASNVEANLCYVDDYDSRLWESFPLNWEDEPTAGPLEWPETPEPPEEEPVSSVLGCQVVFCGQRTTNAVHT